MMEELKEQMNANIQQIEKIENFIALSLKRENVASHILSLATTMENVRKSMLLSYKKLNTELKHLKVEHDQLMRRMREQQGEILEHMLRQKKEKLAKMDFKEGESASLSIVSTAVESTTKQLEPGSAQKVLEERFLKPNSFTTPRQMTISEYKQSPLVLRKRPTQLSFLEFEVDLTKELFDTIPKYMRGRESLDELREFLQSVIIPCFNEKYEMQHRQRKSLRNCNDLELWKLYNEQASYLPDKFFITPGDISRKINKMLDKKLLNRITMLRHIGVLQEQRISQTVFYIWIANK